MFSSEQQQDFFGVISIVLKTHTDAPNLTSTYVHFRCGIIIFSQELKAEIMFHTKSVPDSFLAFTEVILIS